MLAPKDDALLTLQIWSWLLLLAYLAGLLALGWLARVRVGDAYDCATARGSYSPLFLAFAFAATVASGGAFIGFPGIAYSAGTAAVWAILLYPAGVYIGVLVCLQLVTNSGNQFGSRSIPEFLGERYQSEAVRILVSVFSLLLFFYLAGQLVSGIVMFEVMLGLDKGWALLDMNVTLLVWAGSGGLMAAFAGPLVLGSLWKGVTKAGCFAGLIGGAAVFIVTHAGVISPDGLSAGPLREVAQWLQGEAPNPFSCTAMGEIASVVLTWSISLLTKKLPHGHLAILFPAR